MKVFMFAAAMLLSATQALSLNHATAMDQDEMAADFETTLAQTGQMEQMQTEIAQTKKGMDKKAQMKMGEERMMMLKKVENLFKQKTPNAKVLAGRINKILEKPFDPLYEAKKHAAIVQKRQADIAAGKLPPNAPMPGAVAAPPAPAAQAAATQAATQAANSQAAAPGAQPGAQPGMMQTPSGPMQQPQQPHQASAATVGAHPTKSGMQNLMGVKSHHQQSSSMVQTDQESHSGLSQSHTQAHAHGQDPELNDGYIHSHSQTTASHGGGHNSHGNQPQNHAQSNTSAVVAPAVATVASIPEAHTQVSSNVDSQSQGTASLDKCETFDEYMAVKTLLNESGCQSGSQALPCPASVLPNPSLQQMPPVLPQQQAPVMMMPVPQYMPMGGQQMMYPAAAGMMPPMSPMQMIPSPVTPPQAAIAQSSQVSFPSNNGIQVTSTEVNRSPMTGTVVPQASIMVQVDAEPVSDKQSLASLLEKSTSAAVGEQGKDEANEVGVSHQEEFADQLIKTVAPTLIKKASTETTKAKQPSDQTIKEKPDVGNCEDSCPSGSTSQQTVKLDPRERVVAERVIAKLMDPEGKSVYLSDAVQHLPDPPSLRERLAFHDQSKKDLKQKLLEPSNNIDRITLTALQKSHEAQEKSSPEVLRHNAWKSMVQKMQSAVPLTDAVSKEKQVMFKDARTQAQEILKNAMTFKTGDQMMYEKMQTRESPKPAGVIPRKFEVAGSNELAKNGQKIGANTMQRTPVVGNPILRTSTALPALAPMKKETMTLEQAEQVTKVLMPKKLQVQKPEELAQERVQFGQSRLGRAMPHF